MCSAGGSGSEEALTTVCRLVCPRGLTLPRPADNFPAAADQFRCRRDVGVWTPTDRVPSCVGQFVYGLFSPVKCLRCFDAVGWAAGRASGL